MRIINGNNKIGNSYIPTTKNSFVLDKYADKTKKTIATRMMRVEEKVKKIIQDESKLKEFLKLINKELERNISLSMDKIIDKAKEYNM